MVLAIGVALGMGNSTQDCEETAPEMLGTLGDE